MFVKICKERKPDEKYLLNPACMKIETQARINLELSEIISIAKKSS